MESESIREKNADDEPANPLSKSSSEISWRRDRLALPEYFIATKIPAESEIKTKIIVMINLIRFSFKVCVQENRSPFINEWDLYDFIIVYDINFFSEKEHFVCF